MGVRTGRLALAFWLCSVGLTTGAPAQEAIGRTGFDLAAHRVPLSPAEPDLDRVGPLVYQGGLVLRSSDPRLGGLSGLWVDAAGASAMAISDRGYWVRLRLHHEAGRLTDAGGISITPLLAPDGAAVSGDRADAEGLAALGTGFLVSFERVDRVMHYPQADNGATLLPPEIIPMPDALSEAAFNKGLEGLAVLASGQVLALTERTYAGRGHIRGWIIDPADAEEAAPVRLAEKDGFSLTDLARLPNGDVLTLERRYSRAAGPAMQIRRIPGALIRAGARLDGPVLARLTVEHTIDNMEGLAVRTDGLGRIHLYIVSDDNYHALQRTLLLHFVLLEDDASEG